MFIKLHKSNNIAHAQRRTQGQPAHHKAIVISFNVKNVKINTYNTAKHSSKLFQCNIDKKDDHSLDLALHLLPPQGRWRTRTNLWQYLEV